ncbi:hypothetical protein [Vibrio splendidus]|uniref:hypothetical protein n=1 Tax=Vibrio splendidus TaxID=29497 RepID=UPI0021B491C1|nr:hypothetical protein [Vibrio splendidus]UWZ97422.1 hypothetical protein IM698_13750 [Vibrio splendidus]
MNLCQSSSFLNVVLKTKIKQTFLSGIDTTYQADEKWLDKVMDILIYTFMAKVHSINEVIDLNDDESIDECIKIIVIQICDLIQQAIPKVNNLS